ncbi:MAG: type II secretion system protein [Anaerolineae bacterium]|nr:type II secretion system protein [Anaerolineae bacterium]
MQKQDGFTLIELLVVIAIVAILVGIVALSLGGVTERATTASKASELDIVQTAIDTYNTQDVAIDEGTAIPAQATGTTIAAGDGTDAPYFNKYLRRGTKYCYTWAAGGDSLDQVDCPSS